MPIRFRCTYCNRLLGIATRKAGTQTRCPHCGYEITVPVPNEDEGKTERMNLSDVEALLGREVTEVSMAAAAPRPVAAPVEAAPPRAPAAEEPLSLPPEPAPPPPKPRPVPPPLPKAVPKSEPKLEPKPKPAPKPHDPDDPPLFEADVDELLGEAKKERDDERERPPATSGMDAMSLSEPPRQITMSAQKAMLMLVGVVALLALAFAAGMYLAPK
jgi:phage FluMu protein Com